MEKSFQSLTLNLLIGKFWSDVQCNKTNNLYSLMAYRPDITERDLKKIKCPG
jgi:hypothetical protein